MCPSDFVNIGRIKKTYGADGGVSFTIFDDFKDIKESLGQIFIKLEGIFVPFYPLQKKHPFLGKSINFTGVENQSEAEELVGKGIYVAKNAFSLKKTETASTLSNLIGFEIRAADNVSLGHVVAIEELPMQTLLKLSSNALIPLVEEWVQEYLEEEKVLILDLPEGIMEL